MSQAIVSFLNVGQGDTITIEWLDKKGKTNYGIIDCKTVPEIVHNQTLAQNKTFSIKGTNQKIVSSVAQQSEINFLILSHPHIDHFKGLAALFKHCEDNKIIINKVILTFEKIRVFQALVSSKNRKERKKNKRYFRKILGSPTDTKFFQCMEKMFSLKKQKLIKSIAYVDPGPIDLPIPNINLCVLSPTGYERMNFDEKSNNINNVPDQKDSGELINSLSTIISLDYAGHKVIFTADAIPKSLERIITDNLLPNKIKDLLIQLPHHGSSENHILDFYKTLKIRTQGKKLAVVSAGQHRRYAHPHKSVIGEVRKQNYILYSTNYVNGIAQTFSDRNMNRWQGDKVFKISRQGIEFIGSK